ncbi:MAG: phospho-N-acetylmuramoyl-pentapeptide-transferase, partial [Flavobacteriales bacterium]
MLTSLFNYLEMLNIPGAGLFDYISFRAALALITSLIISVIFGKKIIGLLQRQQIGETVRDLGLEGQLAKTGTPTMGGLIILAAILIPTLLFAKLDNIYIITMLLSTVWLGVIGFIDDYIKVFKKNKKGLAGRFKVLGQIGVGIIVGSMLYFSDDVQVHKKVDANYVLAAGDEVVTHLHTDMAIDVNTKWIKTHDMTTTIPFVKSNEFNYNWLLGENSKGWGWLLFIPVVIFIVIA